MNQKSMASLPENYREINAYDFGGASKENLIGLLISAVLLVISVWGGLKLHPFAVVQGAKNSFVVLLYLAGIFLGIVASQRLLGKLTGYLTHRFTGAGVEYVNMGFTLLVSTGKQFIHKKAWMLSALVPTLLWCGVCLSFAFSLSERWFWVPYIMFVVSLTGFGGKIVGAILIAKEPKDTYLQDEVATLKVFHMEG